MGIRRMSLTPASAGYLGPPGSGPASGSSNTQTLALRFAEFLISGVSPANRREWLPPMPTTIARYWRPPTAYVIGLEFGTLLGRVRRRRRPVVEVRAVTARALPGTDACTRVGLGLHERRAERVGAVSRAGW